MKRILVTSALPYINGIKHLGNLVGSMLPADVYARFHRQRGNDVLFICATDEHGTPAELAARADGLAVDEYCRIQHERQADLYRRYSLSFDYFGRSSDPENHALTQQFYRELEANGWIEEHTINLVYSPDDGRFLPDRYVVGTCPHCAYTEARGDQCENCTKVLDPTDLVSPRSAVSGSTRLEVRATSHLFLRQSAFAERIRAWIAEKTTWPVLVTSIALKWLDEGLRDRCITRDLVWGVPVPRPGFEGKVFYVWFDAPIAYLSATRAWSERHPERPAWTSWWQDEDVHYVQFMAKDNVPFHTVSFPCTIMGAATRWKLADYIKGFNWLTFYGGKFSTSQRRGVFMDQALDELPADYWRFFLLANAPESDDSSFTFVRFAQTVNKDLADVFGNFVNRILKFDAARFEGVVPDGGAPGELEIALARDLPERITRYTACLEALEFRKAVAELRGIWSAGNNYLTQAAPWTAIKTDPARAAAGVRTGLNLVRLFCILAWPVIPETCARVLEHLGEPAGTPPWPTAGAEIDLDVLPRGRALTVPSVLFEKLTPERVAELIARYGGDPAEQESPANE